jgi:hypothetical protein
MTVRGTLLDETVSALVLSVVEGSKHLSFGASARRRRVFFGWQSGDSRTRSAGNLPNWYASRTYCGKPLVWRHSL